MNSRKPRSETVSGERIFIGEAKFILLPRFYIFCTLIFVDSSSKVFPCYEILNKTAGVNLKPDDLVFYINPITNEILDEETVKAYRPAPEPESETRNDGGGTSNGPDFIFSKDEMQSAIEDDPKPSLSFSASVPNLHVSTMVTKEKILFIMTLHLTVRTTSGKYFKRF